MTMAQQLSTKHEFALHFFQNPRGFHWFERETVLKVCTIRVVGGMLSQQIFSFDEIPYGQRYLYE